MPTSLLLIFGALLGFSILGFVVAWIALTPTSTESKKSQLELSLKVIEHEAHAARELVGAGGR